MENVSERLKKVLEVLKITPYEFSKVLGYKSPDSIYHILNGKQNISRSMIEKISQNYHDISINWLMVGQGSVFKDPLTALIGKKVNVHLEGFGVEGEVILVPCKVIDFIINDYFFKEKGEPIYIQFSVIPLSDDPMFPKDIDLEDRLETVYLNQITL